MIGKTEIAATAAVAIVAFALVALVWILTLRTVQDQQTELRDKAEQALAGQAGTLAETVAHELLLIDQSLTILQGAWRADSNGFDLRKWQEKMPALMAVTDDLFISDDKRIIRQDILPQAIGQSIGAAYVPFPHGSLETYAADGSRSRGALVLQGQPGSTVDARQFMMYIVRALDHPSGWLIGASYRSTELTKLFAQGALGYNALVALVETRRGIVQAVVGPAARRPKGDISKTALFAALSRAPAGIFRGESGIDAVHRVHAFSRIPDRDMVVIVAAESAAMMGLADTLADGAYVLGAVASGLILAIGGLVLWSLYTVRSHRRRQKILDRNRLELNRLRTEDAVTSARAQINAARLQAILSNTMDGIALFDSSLRLVQWNPSFQRAIGVELRKDMPLDTLLRAQVAQGLFGDVPDAEADVAFRLGVLRAGDVAGLMLPGPDDEELVLRGLPAAEGGFMLLLTGLSRVAPAPPPPVLGETGGVAPEVATAAPIEW